jgi:RNA recognition motif-containing protein
MLQAPGIRRGIFLLEVFVMSAKLYVGNLAFAAKEDDLHNAFSAFGEVKSVKIITDRETGRARGFAFVEMGSPDEAQAALEGMDGKDLVGRPVKVSIAREREERPGGFGGGGGGGGRGGYGGGGGGGRGGYGGGGGGGRGGYGGGGRGGNRDDNYGEE